MSGRDLQPDGEASRVLGQDVLSNDEGEALPEASREDRVGESSPGYLSATWSGVLLGFSMLFVLDGAFVVPFICLLLWVFPRRHRIVGLFRGDAKSENGKEGREQPISVAFFRAISFLIGLLIGVFFGVLGIWMWVCRDGDCMV